MKRSITKRGYRKLLVYKEEVDILNLRIDQLIDRANVITGEKITAENSGNTFAMDFVCNRSAGDLDALLANFGIEVR